MRANRTNLVLSVWLTLCLCFAPTRAGAGTFTGGATEWTQIMNNVQLMEHTINLIQMVMSMHRQVKYMAQHAKSIRSPQEFLQVMSGVGGLISQMRGLLFTGQSIVERWKQTHQGHKDFEQWYSSPAQAYEKIDESTRQAVLRSMKVLDLQANSEDGWPKDREILQQLAAKAQTADGQLKATQVTNDLLLEVIRQLHLLRGVQIAHAEMMGYAISGETQRRQFEDKYMRTRRLGYTGKYRASNTVDPMTATLGYGGGVNPLFGMGSSAPANGPRAPAPGSVGGDEGWEPAKGPRAPAPGTNEGSEDKWEVGKPWH